MCWQTAEDQGQHANLDALDRRSQMLIRLALAHTEVAEAWERAQSAHSLRHCAHGVVEELADVAIRLMEAAWCVDQRLHIIPSAEPYLRIEKFTTLDQVVSRVGCIHVLIARITQSVKQCGVTDAIGPLMEDTLECCWDIAHALTENLLKAIIAKDAKNKMRPYQYGTPSERQSSSASVNRVG